MDELGRTWARLTERIFGGRRGEAYGGLRVLVIDLTHTAHDLTAALEPWLRGGAQITVAASVGFERMRTSPLARRCHRIVSLRPESDGFRTVAASRRDPKTDAAKTDAPVAPVAPVAPTRPWRDRAFDVAVTLVEVVDAAHHAEAALGADVHRWRDAARDAVAVDGIFLDTFLGDVSACVDAWAGDRASPDRDASGIERAWATVDDVRVAIDVEVKAAGEPRLTWCAVRASRRFAFGGDAQPSGRRDLTSTAARALPGGRTRCVEPRRIEVAIERARRGESVVAPPRRMRDGDGSDEAEEAIPAVWSALRRIVAQADPADPRVASDDVDLTALPFAAGWVTASDASTDEAVVAERDVDVMAIVAHPDDEVLELGGALARLVDDGATVHVVVATAGEGGRDARTMAASRDERGAASRDDLRDVRRREHEAALSLLLRRGATVSTLDLADTGKYVDDERQQPMGSVEALRRWGVDAVVGRLVEVIRRRRPLLVLGHAASHDSTWSLHGHHLALGVATAVAIVAAADARVSVGDPRVPPWRTREHRVVIAAEIAESSASPAVITVPIDPSRKADALAAHASQMLSLELPIARLRAAAPEVLAEHFAAGVALRGPRERARRSWLASVATSQRAPPMRWERVLEGPPRTVETLWGTPAHDRWPRPSTSPSNRAALVAALEVGEVAVAAGPAEAASRRAFAEADAVAIVAGQQVGVFGGPAFTLGKAIDAWAHARALRALGILALPVFWMATFDHDLDEVVELYAGRARDPTRVRLRHDGHGKPVGPQPLGAGLDEALALVEQRLAGTPHHAWTMSQLRTLWTPATTFRAAFASLMRVLTAPACDDGEAGLGVVWLDPSTRPFAALGRDVVAAALFRAARVQDALDVGVRHLHALGLAPLIPRARALDGRLHTEIFVTSEAGVRSALWHERDGGWRTAHGRRYTRAELETLLHDAPERLTPSVLLRPLVQARALPVAGFVAGPTELRYLAQLGELHRALGLTAPRILPRRRWSFARRDDAVALAACGVPLALAAGSPDLARDHLRRTAAGESSTLAAPEGPALDQASSGRDGERARMSDTLATLRRLAVRAAELGSPPSEGPPSSRVAPSSAMDALREACAAVSAHARSLDLPKTAARSETLGIALAEGPPERAGARAIRGVWRILRAMRRELDRRDGDTRAAIAALERLSPPHLSSLHAADRELGVVDVMATAGPSVATALAARRLVERSGVAGDGARAPAPSSVADGDTEGPGAHAGSTLVVFDPPAPVAAAAPLERPHPWTDEAARRAVRASLHALAQTSHPVRRSTAAHDEAAHDEAARAAFGAAAASPTRSAGHGRPPRRRVAVLGMGGLGGSGKVAGEVAVIYAQAGHEVWHWTGEGSRWALEFDHTAARGGDDEPHAAASAASVASAAMRRRPTHEVMPVPETPSLRDDLRFQADVEHLAEAIARRIERSPVDVVHVHYADVLLDAVLRARARVDVGRRFAVMVTLHGSDVTALASASPRARELCTMLEACDVVTTPSRFLAAEATLRLGIPSPVVVPNAIDAAEHEPDAGHVLRGHLNGHGAMLVAHASNLRPIKRPLDAARVVATLRARGIAARFVAAGEGPLQTALAEEVASNPHLEAGATLIGACTTAALREVFAAADVVLVTSESESFSLVALEALAAGTLVVGTRCGGLEELLTDTFGQDASAMLAPVGDVEALAERIAALASQPERVAQLQRRAVARTREIHPRDVQRDAYLALLDRVTAGAPR